MILKLPKTSTIYPRRIQRKNIKMSEVKSKEPAINNEKVLNNC